MTEARGLTRQEALWWVAPTLRYWRCCLLEGNGSLGKHLPVLQYTSNLGWYVRNTYDLTQDYKTGAWLDSNRNLFSWRNTEAWHLIKSEMNHSKPQALSDHFGDADTARFRRFIEAAYGRFTAEEAEVASLWVEGETLLCGWDPLPPEDGRLPSKERPENLPITWFGNTEWIHLEDWVWRVDRTDLRYDGIYANE